MFQIFSTFVEQYICLLVFLGKCVCTIKCTPKKAAYLYAKVGATLLMRFKYAAHKNRNFFFLRTEHGRQYFSLPRYGNGPKHHKTKHKKDLGDKSFAALVSNFRSKAQRAAHGRRNFRRPTVRRATKVNFAAHMTYGRRKNRGPYLHMGHGNPERGPYEVWATKQNVAHEPYGPRKLKTRPKRRHRTSLLDFDAHTLGFDCRTSKTVSRPAS